MLILKIDQPAHFHTLLEVLILNRLEVLTLLLLADSDVLHFGPRMIKFLASVFRGLSFIVGFTAPAPGSQEERHFVIFWLGITASMVVFSAILFYAISKMRLP